MLNDLSFLNAGQDWIPLSERGRIALYELNNALYKNDHLQVLDPLLQVIYPEQEVNENVKRVFVNLYRSVSTLWADLLFSEKPTITKADKSTEDYLNKLIKNSRLWKTAEKVAIDVSRYGNGLFRLRTVDAKAVIEATTPRIWFPVINPDNINEVLYHVIAYDFAYNKVQYLKVEIHKKGSIEHKLFIIDKDTNKIKQEVDLTTLDRYKGLKPIEETGVDDFLIFPVNNFSDSESAFGEDDYTDLNPLVSQIELHLSKFGNDLGEQGNLKYGPADAVDEDGKIANTAVSVGNINNPIIFEPPFELTQDELQVWIGISNPQNLFGGGEVWISDDNTTYKQIGIINQSVRQGILTSALPTINGAYDTTNILSVNVSMSNAELLAGTSNDMENLNTLCYVDGELLSYQNATLVDDYEYNLTTLKRGAYYTIPKAHASGTQFCRIDNECFLKVPFTEDDINKKIYIKVCSFNTFNGGLQDLATVQPYEYKILGNAMKIFPNDVTNFNVIQKNAEYVFSWSYTSNDDTYEIREGASWESGVVIGKGITLNTFTSDIIMTGTKTFWIKAYNGTNYSDNATSDVIYIDNCTNDRNCNR